MGTNRIYLKDMVPTIKKGSTSVTMTEIMIVVMATMESRRGEDSSTY